MKKEYKIFNVVVDGRVKEVWSRRDTHMLGEMNGCPNNWWINAGDSSDVKWEPWIDKGTNRTSWDIRVVSGNYSKTKWGEYSVRRNGIVKMICNNIPVYEFMFGDISWGMAKAQTLLVELVEHPFRFSDPYSMMGRKVWYMRQPAIITSLDCLDQGCVLLEREDGREFDMTNPWDDKEWQEIHESESYFTAKDDILSKDIWWFRD